MKENAHQPLAPSPTHERQAWQAQFTTRFNRYKNQLLRRWWLVVAGPALGLIVQITFFCFEPPLFVSCGRMIVNLKLSIPEGSLYTEELNNFLGTQAALMQSAAVVNRAQNRVEERLKAAGMEPVALKALILPKTTIFLLQGTGHDARYTQEFVQACMEEYIQLKKEMRAQTSDTTLAGMTEEVVRIERQLHLCDEELVAFQSSNSVVLLQEQGNSAGSFLVGLSQKLAGLKSEYGLLDMLNLDQNLERQQYASSGPALFTEPPNDDHHSRQSLELTDSGYLRARQQLLLLQSERDDLNQFLRPKHPKMIALEDEIARHEKLLTIFREQSAQQLASRKESLKVQIANLEREVKEWDARALEISRKGAEFQRLKASAQRTQALYDRLLATMQTLDVNKQISPESVTIMESACQGVTNHSGLTRRLLLGGLAGCGLSVLVLLLLDRLDDQIGSFSELRELFSEEVLGQVPREKSEPGLLQLQDERYAFVEAYRNLRSSLLYMSETAHRPRTLLVTSSVPNDGKSLTAANLAISLASAGARVLLVDADLRKGSLHHRFGIAVPAPGLSEVLTTSVDGAHHKEPLIGIAEPCAIPSSAATANAICEPIPSALDNSAHDWSSAVQPTKLANLSLLPRGETTHRASELFLNPLTAQFLQEAAARYEFVLIDTAPVMAADDVTSLAPLVDGVIFVIRAEHSSARVARAALDLLYLRHVRVLGLVFNAVRPTSADYYYYYKYKDYYNSYQGA